MTFNNLAASLEKGPLKQMQPTCEARMGKGQIEQNEKSLLFYTMFLFMYLNYASDIWNVFFTIDDIKADIC